MASSMDGSELKVFDGASLVILGVASNLAVDEELFPRFGNWIVQVINPVACAISRDCHVSVS